MARIREIKYSDGISVTRKRPFSGYRLHHQSRLPHTHRVTLYSSTYAINRLRFSYNLCLFFCACASFDDLISCSPFRQNRESELVYARIHRNRWQPVKSAFSQCRSTSHDALLFCTMATKAAVWHLFLRRFDEQRIRMHIYTAHSFVRMAATHIQA